MKVLKSALVVLDKPKHPQTALDKALELQAATGMHLHLTSFCWNAICEQREIYDTHQRRSMKKEILRAREAWLWDMLRDRSLTAANLHLETVWTNDIAGWVADKVAERDDSLVVKSAHRSESFLHTPLDWNLLHQSPAPVLLVNSRQQKKQPGSDVLATIDLRHNDRKHRTLNLRVLDAAQHFAGITGGKLHCVAVVEYSEVLEDLDFINARRVRKEVIAKTQDLLQAMVEPYGIVQTRIHRPAGKVGQMVATTARKISAGLVVVGSAARGHGLLGDAAEKILDKAPCDVLTVHP